MKITRNLLIIASTLCALTHSSSAELLSYWNFNNVDPAYVPTNLGSFSTTAAGFGEAYTQVDNATPGTLAGNTANSTVFGGTISFANIPDDNSFTINGKTPAAYTNQNATSGAAGYGVFLDSTVNRAGTDSTTGGSLLLLNTSGDLQDKYLTFTLSSAGYDSLTLSYAARVTNNVAASQKWEYSLDDNTYLSLDTISPTANSTFLAQSLNISTLSSNALDNQSTFYLRMSYTTGNNSGSTALDNIQLTGAVIPEPTTTALFMACCVGGMLLLRRRRA